MSGLTARASKVNAQLVEVPCGLCGATQGREIYSGRPLPIESLGRPRVVVTQCTCCGFAFNSPRPSDEALERYYAEDALASGRTFRDDSVDGYYPKLFAERARFYAPFLEHGGKQPAAGRLLDVGCGHGGFLRAMQARLSSGWELVGLEPCEASGRIASGAGFEVRTGYLGDPHFADASFDAISLISVLEHLPHPDQAMAEVVRMLRPGGLLLLEVPNTLEPELSLTSHFGLEHVCHFTPGSLCHLLRSQDVGSVRLDQRVRGRVLRAVASADLASWGCSTSASFADDREEAERGVRRYAERERALLASIDEHVGARLTRWAEEGRTVAIYGAGVHTAELNAHVDLSLASFLVDGDVSKQGTVFCGLPVCAPSVLAERAVDAVLISSHRFVEEMERTVRSLCSSEVEVAHCYPSESNS